MEGSGDVVASGGGLEADSLLGKRVNAMAMSDTTGIWAEYAVADALLCAEMPADFSYKEAVSTVNGYTVEMMKSKIENKGSKAVA